MSASPYLFNPSMPPVFVPVAVAGADVFAGRGFPTIGAGVFVTALDAVALTEAEGGVTFFTVAGGGVVVTRGVDAVTLVDGEATGGMFLTAGAGGVFTRGVAARSGGLAGGVTLLVNGVAGGLAGVVATRGVRLEGNGAFFVVADGEVVTTRGVDVVILAGGETTGGTFRTAGVGGVLTGGATIHDGGVIGEGGFLVNGTASGLAGGATARGC
jgi:hypothetical protein